MALAPANWVSREQLCALLWPDRSDAQARQSLSQALSALRRGLGEAAILADRNAAGLASQEIVVDVVRFSELAAHGDLVSLGEAASLLHGPLLPGFFVGVDSFDDWLALERARIGSEAVSAMLRLGDMAMAGGDLGLAQTAFEKALVLDTAEERAHAGLMRLHLVQGRPAAALRQFERAAAVLARQVEAPPGEELSKLRTRAHNANSSESAHHEEAIRPTIPPTYGARLSLPVSSLRVPLVVMGVFAEDGGQNELGPFVEVLPDEVATALARSSWVRVQRVSIEAGAVPTSECRYRVDAKVRRLGGRVRVSCQITAAATKQVVWGTSFETPSAITRALAAAVPRIVGCVEYGIQRAETQAAAGLPAQKRLEPYEKYLLALKLYYQYGAAPIGRSIALLREALEEEPGFVRAKALMAAAYASKIMRGAGVPGDREAGIALAYEVYCSGTDDPDALQWAADPLTQVAGDHEAAHAAASRALRVHPNSAMALTVLGHIHCFADDPKPAVKCFERALELAPENPHYGHMVLGLGRSLMMLGRGNDGIPYLRRSVQGLPGPDTGLRWWIHGLMREGRKEEAQQAALSLRRQFPEFRVSLAISRLPRNFFSLAFMAEHHETLVAAGAPE